MNDSPNSQNRLLLSGNEAVAHGALDAGVHLGTGYPGTPSTEILENFSELGGRAQWAPNEKVALEVGLGAAFAGARVLVTMKHVGLNVAADPLFTAALTDVVGGLVIISADDPGMASSQNEQDNRRYAEAAGVPMLEPSDSDEAYRMVGEAMALSEAHRIPVILRLTTRICHSKTVVHRTGLDGPSREIRYERDLPNRVMIPAYARLAHRKLRSKLAHLATWAEGWDLNVEMPAETPAGDGGETLGIVTGGISYVHAREAAPQAKILKLGICHPLPIERIRRFAETVDRCVVIEEGDPYLVTALRAAGLDVEGKAEMYRFGELNVERVRRILARDESPEPVPAKGRPPRLCPGCPHRKAFGILSELGCIVTGDIGCYTLGVLPPFEAMDTCVCMGAAIGVGLGLRHVLPDEQARKVVSVIGDSTFAHSGLTGLEEMVYNRPPTGHVVLILDNDTTAMTGMQEHPGTGRSLDHSPANRIAFEQVARAMGIENVQVVDPITDPDTLEQAIRDAVGSDRLSVIIARRPCLLAAGKIAEYNQLAQGSAPGAGVQS